MSKIVLKDFPIDFLFPFSLTRSVTDIRIGILTLRQKWEHYSGVTVDFAVQNEAIPSNIIPSAKTVHALKEGSLNFSDEEKLEYPWQIFKLTDKGIRNDFALITKNKTTQQLSPTNKSISPENIFVEEGAKIEHSVLNASTGPIYISGNAEIMEGCLIRGPFFLGEESIMKMGTKIYGATSIGKKCVIGGEVKNSVFFDYSNKAHEGYIGDSVIGEWCNLGAGTSNSNIKNTASDVNVWHPASKKFLNAGMKCGLLMGAYSRSAINISFNTGTVTGICCNVFGEGLTPKYIPSFSWGFVENQKYKIEKALNDIGNWKKLKNETLTDIEIQNLKHIFENS